MARRNARSITESIVKLSGSPRLLGTIDYTNVSKTNAQATTPFGTTHPYLSGKILLLQPSTDVYILPVATSTGTVSSSTGILVLANERVQICMDDVELQAITGEVYAWLAAIRSASSGNLRVWEML